MTFGTHLKQARQKQNLTQQQLADQLHVSRQTISGWENGRTYPDIDALIALSDLFGLSLDDLIRGDHKLAADMQAKAQAATKAQRAYSVLLVAVAILMVLVLGALFDWPWLQTPPLVQAMLVMVLSCSIAALQFVRQRYWYLRQPKLLPIYTRFAILFVGIIAFLILLYLAFGLSLEFYAAGGAALVVSGVAVGHAIKHPDDNFPSDKEA